MESVGTMVEGGEWCSFNGVSVNEEAKFLAHMFPTSYNLLTNNELDGSYSAFWAPHEPTLSNASVDNVSFYSSDDSSLYSSFSQGSGSSYGQENYYLSDSQEFLAANNASLPTLGFPVLSNPKGFLSVFLANSTMEAEDTQIDFLNTHLQLKCPQEMVEIVASDGCEDKSGDDSNDTEKRSRISETRKRNVRSKKNQSVVEPDHEMNSISLEEDSNGLPERSTAGGSSSVLSPNASSPPNLNGKTRASRGSATDPQSLYARKRRERINERLRTLQNLVPNGAKVDISTMLEEAIHYVKFLQLQIKLLSSDELWKYAPLACSGLFLEHMNADLMRKNDLMKLNSS
ncbi:hypothetical protein Cgig2_017165 [Carnegiea gigantea]|uniref:BHLH domain-containing protein n=1 Tax=Carnegiea gigantea TaxID=171969 RepID=A0A9Q1KA47_9CARY|nr:hypothetical protein Cgig2_017165 [Carnegiea gigantea]